MQSIFVIDVLFCYRFIKSHYFWGYGDVRMRGYQQAPEVHGPNNIGM